ncbi:MAG: hypothetical protein JWN62_3074 [Acidimicrobiales bacterium]|nr:hypothetical protein [Acidimicrobiales bacterium]
MVCWRATKVSSPTGEPTAQWLTAPARVSLWFVQVMSVVLARCSPARQIRPWPLLRERRSTSAPGDRGSRRASVVAADAQAWLCRAVLSRARDMAWTSPKAGSGWNCAGGAVRVQLRRRWRSGRNQWQLSWSALRSLTESVDSGVDGDSVDFVRSSFAWLQRPQFASPSSPADSGPSSSRVYRSAGETMLRAQPVARRRNGDVHLERFGQVRSRPLRVGGVPGDASIRDVATATAVIAAGALRGSGGLARSSKGCRGLEESEGQRSSPEADGCLRGVVEHKTESVALSGV